MREITLSGEGMGPSHGADEVVVTGRARRHGLAVTRTKRDCGRWAEGWLLSDRVVDTAFLVLFAVGRLAGTLGTFDLAVSRRDFAAVEQELEHLL